MYDCFRIQFAAALLLVACTAEPGSDGTASGSGSESGSTTLASSSGSTTGSSGLSGSTGQSTVGSDESEGSTGGGTTNSSTDGSSSARMSSSDSTGDGSEASTGGDAFAIDCDAVAMPVWVEGGGGYNTIQDGVDGAPPGGTVYVCAGLYEEEINSEFPVTVIGEGADLVTVQGSGAMPAVFEIVAPTTLQGLTISGGSRGVIATIGGDELSVFEDIQVIDVAQTGFELNGFGKGANRVDFESVEIRGVEGSGNPGGGIYFANVDAQLVDCVLEANTTTGQGGAMYIRDSDVTFVGGAVRNNASAQGGGGAFLDRTLTGESNLTITNSDWGTGAANENEDEDVLCDGGTAYPFFGVDTNATCNIINGGPPDCCEFD